MKVLFLHTAHPRLNLIAQIQLEILLEHLNNDDSIFLLPSDKRIVSSQTNYLTPNFAYYHYDKVYKKTLKILKKYGEVSDSPGYIENKDVKDLNFIFNSIEELKKIKYKDVNIGLGVASSIISLYRDHFVDVEKYKNEIYREIIAAISVIDTLEESFSIIKPDLIYVFNGRMSTYSPAIQYCEKNKINFRVFEFTSRYEKYHILNNAIPHNVSYREQEMKDAWAENNDLEYKTKVSREFFESQRKGISLMEGSFISYQNENELPYFDKNKEIITFFNSSIDEFAAVPGWENYIYVYSDETEAIWDVCKNFELDLSKQFILRIHPNLKFLDNTQTRNLEKLKELTNLIVVTSTSTISSYSLIDVSDKIITFGSTIGIEACYFEKPSILLGLSFFNNLDVAYLPNSKEELMNLIGDKHLKPRPAKNVHIYGYWWMTFGKEFYLREKQYKPSDLDPTLLEISLGLIKKIASISLWKRSFKMLIDKNTLKKIKNLTYRQAILRELKPWIKK
ncbi:hypothetical protein SAMN05444396_10726 [Flavobacterium segetis]|uniref:Capsule polysaccharide biosynthesis protein n=1 Tax=Flavobacterium segetis TaxID=271157 RepID=A0A1M5IFL1_9FLAO|nr:hypothetical protein [Flavobacterium segetis]SHG27138.1 hypothetical protein SAMN05444396_10726 [Flavobacterium segetis]